MQHDGNYALAMKLRERFMDSIEFEPNTGCWLWAKAVGAHGYGEFWNGIRITRAHRWAYQHFEECIPNSLVIDHKCRVKCCVNPDHLEPVTQRTNVLRGTAPAALQAARTHCIHGHPLDWQNTYIKPNGSRQCKTCRRMTDKKRYANANR